MQKKRHAPEQVVAYDCFANHQQFNLLLKAFQSPTLVSVFYWGIYRKDDVVKSYNGYIL